MRGVSSRIGSTKDHLGRRPDPVEFGILEGDSGPKAIPLEKRLDHRSLAGQDIAYLEPPLRVVADDLHPTGLKRLAQTIADRVLPVAHTGGSGDRRATRFQWVRSIK